MVWLFSRMISINKLEVINISIKVKPVKRASEQAGRKIRVDITQLRALKIVDGRMCHRISLGCLTMFMIVTAEPIIGDKNVSLYWL